MQNQKVTRLLDNLQEGIDKTRQELRCLETESTTPQRITASSSSAQQNTTTNANRQERVDHELRLVVPHFATTKC